MTTQSVELHTTCLLRYVIASADMYYAEMEQRDVFLSCDEHGNFRFWGEVNYHRQRRWLWDNTPGRRALPVAY